VGLHIASQNEHLSLGNPALKFGTTTFHGAINYSTVLQTNSLVRDHNGVGPEAQGLDY